MTIEQMLSDWDSGKSVWTLEMGGIGPGYEQAIQVLMIELLRDNRGKELSDDPGSEWGESTVSRVNATCGGFSGAQVGAAKQLAYGLLKHGPDGFWEHVKQVAPDRLKNKILVSSFWPSAKLPLEQANA